MADEDGDEYEKQPMLTNSVQSAPAKKSQRPLLIAFLALVVVGLGNKLFQKFMTIPLYNYPFFVNLFSSFVYIPLSFAYVFPMMKWGKAITYEQTIIPKWKFAVMGILDALAGIMQVFAVNYITSGSLIILLQQAAIPISMVISYFLLKARYKVFQYIGAFIVIIGLGTVLLPSFLSPDDASSSGQSQVLWAFVMVASCIPMTLSSVFKEKALGETDIDVVYLNGWISLFQFLASLPLLPPSAPVQGLNIDEMPKNIYDGLLCYGGINSIMEDVYGGDPPQIIKHKDDCYFTGPLYLSVYLAFNISYNILIILILKYGSSNILWLAMTVMVPLGNIAFALEFVPGHHPLKPTDIAGLVVIMTGLILYRFYDKLKAKLGPLLCHTKPAEDELDDDDEHAVSRRATGYLSVRSASFCESMGPLVDNLRTRQKLAERTPTQIRSAYFTRLGIAAGGGRSKLNSIPFDEEA